MLDQAERIDLNQLLQTPAGILTSDIIRRNIQPFANLEFANLIDSLGDVNGPVLLKKILTLKGNEISQNEQEIGINLIQAYLIPNRTIFQSFFKRNNNLARALFSLFLIDFLEKHYVDLEKNGKAREKQELEIWLPTWTKKFTAMIKQEMIHHGIKHNYTKLKALLAIASCFYIAYYYMLLARDKNYAVLTGVTTVFAVYGLLHFADVYLEYNLEIYLAKKRDQDSLEHVWHEINNLINKIESRKLSDVSVNEQVDPLLSLLFNRSQPV